VADWADIEARALARLELLVPQLGDAALVRMRRQLRYGREFAPSVALDALLVEIDARIAALRGIEASLLPGSLTGDVGDFPPGDLAG
jgi:hypothetical protein